MEPAFAARDAGASAVVESSRVLSDQSSFVPPTTVVSIQSHLPLTDALPGGQADSDIRTET